MLLCALLLGALVGASPATAATISVDDAAVTESGTTVDATFTVTRSFDLLAIFETTVDFATTDGTATSPADFAARIGTLTLPPSSLGAQTRQVTVVVENDARDEFDETFALVLTGTEVLDGSATATITDDDPPPVVSVVDSAAVAEGAPGAQAAFAVQLSPVSGRAVSVDYATADGGATAGQDYTPASGTLVLPAGAAQVALAVGLLDDTTDEPAETFELRLSSPAGATLGDDVGAATILDDDEPPATGTTPGGGTVSPRPSTTSLALPVLNSTAPVPGSSATPATLGLSRPRLRRPSTVLVTVSCPQASGTCKGRVTVFRIASRRSKIKALRRERRLRRATFSLRGGRSRTLTLLLGRSDRGLLQRTGRMRVRAYAVSTDAAGRASTRSVTGTLIARTAHSGPSR